jgi:hypothetical protein
MTKKELCSMCTEYMVDAKCEMEKDCKLLKLLNDNTQLRKKLKEARRDLKEKNHESYLRSWEKSPDRMGW